MCMLLIMGVYGRGTKCNKAIGATTNISLYCMHIACCSGHKIRFDSRIKGPKQKKRPWHKTITFYAIALLWSSKWLDLSSNLSLVSAYYFILMSVLSHSKKRYCNGQRNILNTLYRRWDAKYIIAQCAVCLFVCMYVLLLLYQNKVNVTGHFFQFLNKAITNSLPIKTAIRRFRSYLSLRFSISSFWIYPWGVQSDSQSVHHIILNQCCFYLL